MLTIRSTTFVRMCLSTRSASSGLLQNFGSHLEIVQEGSHARCHLENVARLRYGEDGRIVALVEKALEDGVSKHFAGAGGHRLEA